MKNKVFDLREVVCHVQFEYFIIRETKLDHSVPSAQFKLADYEIRAKMDRDRNRGGITEYARKGVICQTKRI